MKYSVGIDIGGTLTDVVLMDERGGIIAEHKVDTTPAALENCFVHALGRATEKLQPAQVHRILHATTVATNSILEGRGGDRGRVQDAVHLRRLQLFRRKCTASCTRPRSPPIPSSRDAARAP